MTIQQGSEEQKRDGGGGGGEAGALRQFYRFGVVAAAVVLTGVGVCAG